MTEEEKYIQKRLLKGFIQSIPFYLCRIFPINKKKIVFCTIEGTTGFTCNPKYIALELINQKEDFELVWLVNDPTKVFPKEIKVVKNSLWNRAYHLSTAKFWIDNSRKQLECRKRKGQIYIQTWHAKLGFKPTCLDRGESFSKIAYLVSKHDSDMVDYWLSNSDWYDNTLKTGSLYEGETIRCGSPRCDILVKSKNDKAFKDNIKTEICNRYGIEKENPFFLMYAPTFRGGSQQTNREIESGDHMPDFEKLKSALEEKFGGTWFIFLRLHPQLTARNIESGKNKKYLIDISKVDDMYEILAGCDAFITDYSSAAFDAAVMEIPIWLYCDDYIEYENERGKLLWNLRELPFGFAEDDFELNNQITHFDDKQYRKTFKMLFDNVRIIENGMASKQVLKLITKL